MAQMNGQNSQVGVRAAAAPPPLLPPLPSLPRYRCQRHRLTALPALNAGGALVLLAFLLLAPLAVLMEAAVDGKLGELRCDSSTDCGCLPPSRCRTAVLISR